MSENVKLFWFLGKPCKITSTLFFAVFATCFGSSMIFGYSMAVLNNLEEDVKCFLLSSYCNNNTDKEEKIKANAYYASLTASYIVLGTVGSFISGIISNTFGRKTSLVLNNIIAIIGCLINLLVHFTKSKVNIFIGRLILGLNAGLTTGIAPTFIAEITPTPIRGTLTACHQLLITIGIALAYFFTMKFMLNKKFWVVSLGLPMIPAFTSLIILPFCPESPRYLFINKNKQEEAKLAFSRYNQIQDADSQLKEIQIELDAERSLPSFKAIDLFTSSIYRIPLLVSIVLNVMQQFSGINAIIGYSKIMMTSANVPEDYLEFCVLLFGIFNALCTIPSVILMEIGGRRNLLIYPTFLVIASLFICFFMSEVMPVINPANKTTWAIMSVLAICTYLMGFAAGLGPIPGIVVAEMFTQGPRAVAYSIAMAIQWFSSFIILLLYPIVNSVISTGHLFLIFMCFVIPSLIFLIIFMPETKNRSFADIATDTAKGQTKVQPV